MIISIKDLKDQCDKKNVNWLQSKSVISRLKTLIKNENLPEDVVKFLWQERTLRWDLVRRQHLPDSIIFFIIDNYNNTREISKSIYEETLQNQDINSLHVKYIESKYFSDSNIRQYLNTWKVVPGKMIENSSIDNFFYLLQQYPNNCQNEDYVKALVEIIRFDNTSILKLISYLELHNLTKLLDISYSSLLMVLSSTVFFTDNTILTLLPILSSTTIKSIAPKLISRSNCSLATKALLLLYN